MRFLPSSMSPKTFNRIVVLVVGLAPSLSCGDRTISAPSSLRPALSVIAGDGQLGLVGDALPNQLQVQFQRCAANQSPPCPGFDGENVDFVVTSGGGSLFVGTVQTATFCTDPKVLTTCRRGMAFNKWTLGTRAGTQSVEARVSFSAKDELTVVGSFTATAKALGPQVMKKLAGDAQSAVVGTSVPIAPIVQVVDKYDNGIAGQALSFSTGNNGGTVTYGGNGSTTDASGRVALASWVLSSVAGANTLNVTLSANPSLATSFSALGIAGNSAHVVASVTQFPPARVGSTLTPLLKVVDASGNGVANLPVTFTVKSGAGNLEGVNALTVLTQADGVASIPWTLGLVSAANSLQANVVGVAGSPVLFRAEGYCNCWRPLSPLTEARYGVAADGANGLIYASGGSTNQVYSREFMRNTLEVYDVASNTWTAKAPMPTPRYYHSGTLVNGIFFAVGGWDNDNAMATVEAYDPATDTWSTKAPMPTPRHTFATVAINGILYAIGGQSRAGIFATLEAYNPATDSWVTKASMPTSRHYLAATALNGILYVLGGTNDEVTPLSTVEAYDPRTNTWTTKAPMPTARYTLAAAAVNGRIYAIGGQQRGGFTNILEVYDPAADAWTIIGEIPEPVDVAASVALNGTVFVIGGWQTFGPLPSASVRSLIP